MPVSVKFLLPDTFALLLILLFGLAVQAQEPNHQQHGGGQMKDMQTIHTLFEHNEKITRTVKLIKTGVETLTDSDDPKVQALIIEHTLAMQKRLENKQPIRQWDPLFAELFKNADKIKLEITRTPKGVKVMETASDPYVVKLVQAHAQGVSEFVLEGTSSMAKRHELPETKAKTDTAEKKEAAKAFQGKCDGVTTCPVTGEPVDKKSAQKFSGELSISAAQVAAIP